MHVPDLINSLFELVGGTVLLLDVYKLYMDKQFKGVHLAPRFFFTAWGLWNLWYYPYLEQWLSFGGGLFIVFSNVVWLILALYYMGRGVKTC